MDGGTTQSTVALAADRQLAQARPVPPHGQWPQVLSRTVSRYGLPDATRHLGQAGKGSRRFRWPDLVAPPHATLYRDIRYHFTKHESSP